MKVLENGIIPDVIPSKSNFRDEDNLVPLSVKYHIPVETGMTMTMQETSTCPEVHFDGFDEMYVVVMTDPDAPSRAAPRFREWCHWISKFTPQEKMKRDDLLKYVGPSPPKGTGLHRYVFLLFSAKKDSTFSDIPSSDNMDTRRSFSAMEWAKKHGLELLGTEYFQCQRE